MICVMMNLNNYAKILGEKIITIYVLINLKKGIKQGVEFVMKAKTHILNVFLKLIHSSFCNQMSVQKLSLFLFRDNK